MELRSCYFWKIQTRRKHAGSLGLTFSPYANLQTPSHLVPLSPPLNVMTIGGQRPSFPLPYVFHLPKFGFAPFSLHYYLVVSMPLWESRNGQLGHGNGHLIVSAR